MRVNTGRWTEVQCDGLVGPTHHYAGLSHGNVASQSNALSVSAPKKAALQGLAKMQFVASLGVPQLVAPPQPRPNVRWLHRLGFSGTLTHVLEAAWKASPALLYQAYSASSMWAANMATISPSCDSADGRLHVTTANLCTTPHRVQEQDFSAPLLNTLLCEAAILHAPLPSTPTYADEGAANHMRFCGESNASGVQVFVYGKIASERESPQPIHFPARQTRESVEALARLHHLPLSRCVFVQQQPSAIDAGVFHNDVIAMSHGSLLIYHAQAFCDEERFIAELRAKLAPAELIAIRITEDELPLQEAVLSYFFNSQIVTAANGSMVIIAPAECEASPQAHRLFQHFMATTHIPVQAVHYLDVRESMRNGGGPACLRLRIPLHHDEWARVHPAFIYTPALHAALERWINHHYRDELHADDLRDAVFAEEVLNACEALREIFPLPLSYGHGF